MPRPPASIFVKIFLQAEKTPLPEYAGKRGLFYKRGGVKKDSFSPQNTLAKAGMLCDFPWLQDITPAREKQGKQAEKNLIHFEALYF